MSVGRILGNGWQTPGPQEWVKADWTYALECRNEAAAIRNDSATAESQAQFEESVAACNAVLDGQEVWIAKPENGSRTRFAIGTRYVPDGEHVNLDELLEEAKNGLVDSPNEDADLTDGEPFKGVLDELRRRELIELRGTSLLFDSFAPEEEFQGAVIEAIECWDMNTRDRSGTDSEEEEDLFLEW